jgi:hypothetical protein
MAPHVCRSIGPLACTRLLLQVSTTTCLSCGKPMPEDRADIVKLCQPEEETITARIQLLDQQKAAKAARDEKVWPLRGKRGWGTMLGGGGGGLK